MYTRVIVERVQPHGGKDRGERLESVGSHPVLPGSLLCRVRKGYFSLHRDDLKVKRVTGRAWIEKERDEKSVPSKVP